MSTTAVVDRPPATARAVARAEAHRDNGRRLMGEALQAREDSLMEAFEILRQLSRIEYAHACAVLLDELNRDTKKRKRTGS